MLAARPILESVLLAPLERKTHVEVGRLQKRAAKIFDRYEAKFKDRGVMDRAVDDLVDAAQGFIRASAALHNMTDPPAGPDVFPPCVAQILSNDDMSGISAEEKWLLSLFRAAVWKPSTLPTRVLEQSVVERHPWLLSAWPPNADASAVADASQCLDPLTATAYLLHVDPISIEAGGVRAWVSDHAPWLLAHFSAHNDRERAALDEFHRCQRDLLDRHVSDLRGHYVDLAELADRNPDRVSDAISAIERAAATDLYQDAALVAGWAKFVVGNVAEHVARTVQIVASDAMRDSGFPPAEVARLVELRRYSDLHRRRMRSIEVGTAVRATPFRRDAVDLWPTPRQSLSSLAGEVDSPVNEHLRTLIHDWCHASRDGASPLGSDKQQQLRERFLEVVLDLTARKRKKKITLNKGVHKFSCADVIDWLPSSAQTPTFLPQIRRYTDISIKVLSAASADRSLPSKALALSEEGAITIILAPGLSAQMREETTRQLRLNSGRPTAIFDDLDLCRMLNPRGAQPHLVEALIELVVEQQRWNEFGPYEVQEGQHVRMEMYVGRRPEAERLVTGTTYSRIFSGRRLGKTALLRYVEHRYDRSPLASGNKLRVLYVPIVGLGSEQDVVAEIVSKLEAAVEIRSPAQRDPRARLKAAITAALEQRPDESYLVFLDEADTFFENQTRADAANSADYESSLSWVMRASEGERDSRQLPRIRFVVCGYRATNRSEGAWGNWGDVLLLNPLDQADAVQLVTGPLARLGVDARDQAGGIAFRCGYQPAVIIYFCTRLLAELDRRTAFTEREKSIVCAQDVVSVFQLPEVQDRVRETVWLNFVGDPLGQLTFAAFLAEAAGLPPGTPVDDAPQRLLAQVTRVADERAVVQWTTGSWQDIGARHLRDLVKRSLLAEAEHHPPSLRLRFPHQLPILLQESPQLRIRDALDRLGASRSASSQRSAWLVPDDVLENMRWALSDEGWQCGVRAVVFGSHWTEPLLTRTGLQHRLPPERLLCRTGVPTDLDTPVEHALALVGGVDLLRAALSRQVVVGSAIEIARLGRFSEEAIDSYFKRVRGIEFSSPGALQRIINSTGGVPLMVERLSDCFPNESTVDSAQLEAALSRVTKAVPQLARELFKGRPDRRLDRRECELLVAVLAASSFDPDCVGDVLSDAELLQAAVDGLMRACLGAAHGKLLVLPRGSGDNERLALLLNLGLLVRRQLGQAAGLALSEVAPVPEGDVVLSLLPYILQALVP